MSARRAPPRLYHGWQMGVSRNTANRTYCFTSVQSISVAPRMRCAVKVAISLRTPPVMPLVTKGRSSSRWRYEAQRPPCDVASGVADANANRNPYANRPLEVGRLISQLTLRNARSAGGVMPSSLATILPFLYSRNNHLCTVLPRTRLKVPVLTDTIV